VTLVDIPGTMGGGGGPMMGGGGGAKTDYRMLAAIVDHAKVLGLPTAEHDKLKAAVDTLGFLTLELESKNASIARLRKYLFGASTEKASQLFDGDEEESAASADQDLTQDGLRVKKIHHHVLLVQLTRLKVESHPPVVPVDGLQCPIAQIGRAHV